LQGVVLLVKQDQLHLADLPGLFCCINDTCNKLVRRSKKKAIAYGPSMESRSVLRLLISLNPPPEIVSGLRDQQNFLRQRLNEHYGSELSVRWTKPAQFHLTLLFLGNLFWQQVEWIRQQIAETVAAAKALPTLQLSGFGCFPVFQSPRILWIGVQRDARLKTLQTDLLARFSRHLALDDRDTSYPHITLGRMTERHRLNGFAALLRDSVGPGAPPIIPWKTKSISLTHSIPGSHGVEYSCLAEFFAPSSDDGA
jgi:RNA 2',3'-cyclic 3'-phosphodiesterase